MRTSVIKKNTLNILLCCLAYLYLIMLGIAVCIMEFGGDRWLLGTLMLFGPRWLLGVPLPFLLLAALWQKNRHMVLPLFGSAVIFFVPLLDLHVSFRRGAHQESPQVRIASCNVGKDASVPSKLLGSVGPNGVQILALQECPADVKGKLPDNLHVVQKGELAVISPYPLTEVGTYMAFHPPHKWPRLCALHCVVHLPEKDISFVTVHLPSPRYGLQHLVDRRKVINLSKKGLLQEETANRRKAARAVKELVASSTLPVIIAGDFNTPVQSSIYKEVWHGFTNAFSETGSGFGWTEYNRFSGIPIAVRIDHILTGPGLAPLRCQVGPDVGSDHLPILADVTMSQ